MNELNNILQEKERVVEEKNLGLITPEYHIFTPFGEDRFDLQWQSCFDRFHHFCQKKTGKRPFIVRVFLDAGNSEEFKQRAIMVKHTFATKGIPVSILSESPEKPEYVMIEAGFASARAVTYGKAGRIQFSRLKQGDTEEYWFAGVEGTAGTTMIEAADEAFQQLQLAFRQLNLSFNDIVRQWNYVEQIFNFTTISLKQRQNYQQFNETRSKYYTRYRTAPDFPAATGIGTAYHGITIDCVAIRSNNGLVVKAITNPKQSNAYKYNQSVLKGEPAANKQANQAPQFERAKLITDGSISRVFVSGTASIIGQETIGVDDVVKQTRVTIDNIEKLTSVENLKAHHPDLKVIPGKFAYIRVYVKRENDIQTVKDICREHYGEVPMSIVTADICRSDLLVEIETEKVSSMSMVLETRYG